MPGPEGTRLNDEAPLGLSTTLVPEPAAQKRAPARYGGREGSGSGFFVPSPASAVGRGRYPMGREQTWISLDDSRRMVLVRRGSLKDGAASLTRIRVIATLPLRYLPLPGLSGRGWRFSAG